MPGIAAIISNAQGQLDHAPRMKAGLTVESKHALTSFKGSACSGVLHHLGLFNHAMIAEGLQGKVGVVLDGWIFNDGVDGDASSYVLSRYMEEGVECVGRLNGQFNLLIWDHRSDEVTFANDHYASRPVFYHENTQALYIASEAKAILEVAPQAKKLNERTLVNQLSYSRIWIGQDTFFKGVQALAPASWIRWKAGKVCVERYWHTTFNPVDVVDDDFVDHSAQAYRHALERQTALKGRKGIFLSGGLDSRSTLSAFPESIRSEMTACTYGVDPNFDEVAIARRVAKYLGVKWKWLPFTPADCIAQASKGVRLTEGLDIFAQSFSLSAFPQVSETIDIAYNGFLIDLVLGGTYINEELVSNPYDHDLGVQHVLKKFRYFSKRETDALFKFDGADDLLQSLSDELKSLYMNSRNDRAPDRIDEVGVNQRFGRNLYMRLRWFAQYFENICSVLDDEFVDHYLKIPATDRLDYTFYNRFMKSLDRGCTWIPSNNTRMPSAMPFPLWKYGTRLEAKREQLYRTIYRMTRGKVFLRYKHFYSNFDEWMRADPAWVEASDDLLLSADSLCCQRYLNRSVIARMVREQRSGERSHYAKLIQIMTLELFLREFFPTG